MTGIPSQSPPKYCAYFGIRGRWTDNTWPPRRPFSSGRHERLRAATRITAIPALQATNRKAAERSGTANICSASREVGALPARICRRFDFTIRQAPSARVEGHSTSRPTNLPRLRSMHPC